VETGPCMGGGAMMLAPWLFKNSMRLWLTGDGRDGGGPGGCVTGVVARLAGIGTRYAG
jgi:hypothetical protein